jgi:hypothetical protein
VKKVTADQFSNRVVVELGSLDAEMSLYIHMPHHEAQSGDLEVDREATEALVKDWMKYRRRVRVTVEVIDP